MKNYITLFPDDQPNTFPGDQMKSKLYGSVYFGNFVTRDIAV